MHDRPFVGPGVNGILEAAWEAGATDLLLTACHIIIRFALTIAETGHLVLASLHTNDTTQALARIIDVFPAQQQAQVRTQLAAALTGIVYQRLIPKNGGEVLVANTAVRNLIKEGKTHQLRNALVTGQQEGMVTFEQSLSALVRSGVINYDDAVARSLYPKEVGRTGLAVVR